ncbi:2'-5' RNA ligase family protein [Actinomycetospora termitidis]|uniref:2'-5' RNA ligase family protein n=1 Tax=Actinomycetospora termitidis TaxID=3053470 RepID=A0ABT7MCY5_9PSEU|nr:2'-5' RNA ligase family protein [Actinomycetospora sp. Odt1-22]MDL5158527.1 2'-5' RNA ligase family protein [Actinomycetospora sp. Odt1-22]
MTDPLIVSAVLAPDAQADLDAQRRRWFPADRLHVGAHITLFHALPGERIDEVAALLGELVERPGPALHVGEPFKLGRGVGLRLQSSALEGLRGAIARRFEADLTDQDARRWRPHVTIQNKVTPDEARRTLETVRETHVPYDTHVEALALWHYRGGPWEAAGEYRFGGPASSE